MNYIIILICIVLIYLYFYDEYSTFENVEYNISIMILYNLDNTYNLELNKKKNIHLMDAINTGKPMIYHYSDFVECPYKQLKIWRRKYCHNKNNLCGLYNTYLIIGPTTWFIDNNLEDKIIVTIYLKTS